MSEQDAVAVANLQWNGNVSVATITLMLYEFLLLIDKEIEYVWKRPWSVMSCLYLIVRYLGLFLALICGCWGGLLYMPVSPCYDLIVLIEWGFSLYFWFAEAILIWRLYALYKRSKPILYVLLSLFLLIIVLSMVSDIFLYSRPGAFSVKEIVTPYTKYCTLSFNIGPMLAIYTSIPIVCYDIVLLVLAVVALVKHLKEQKDDKMRPNTYVIIIVRHHIIYFVVNLINQSLLTMLWAKVPTPVMSLSELFNDTAAFIFAPRLIISIWDTHAHDNCIHVNAAFVDCACWTSPISEFEQYEMNPQLTV